MPDSPDVVPLFPLQTVLFPHQILPLHIFEPRYRAMAEDAIAGERLIAIALLQPGFEPLYETNIAPIHSIVGAGRIISHERLPDGRFNLLIRGEARARLMEEFPGRPYRFARVEWLRPASPAAETWRHELSEAVVEHLLVDPILREHCLRLFEMPMEVADLADVIGGALPLDVELRQGLLAASEVESRVRLLIAHLRTLGAVTRQTTLNRRADHAGLN